MEHSPRDLTAEESRVLGCLIEKEATTPDNYPLTVNALRNACNQSTSRDPVMEMTDLDVTAALETLRARGMTRTVHSTSNRATKYRHVLPDVLGLTREETAVLSVLLLRGEQTVGELKSRCDRQHHFSSTDDVAATLAALAGRDVPLAVELDRRPGQKDSRWIELLSATRADERTPSPGSVLDASVSTDPYGEATAEFYDLLATGDWETFGLHLLDLLAGADPTVGPIVDVGSGTGIGLRHLDAALPGVRIHAIEPSKAMRAALHARLADDDGLRARTTVDPRSFLDARLPPRACALVANAAFGHLGDAELDRLWRFVAEQMPPGAPAVIELLPPDRPITVPPTRYRQVQVGDFVYEGWQEGEPIDERTMRWTMTYKVLDGTTGSDAEGVEGVEHSDDDVVAEYRVSAPWRCVSLADVRAATAPYGLVVTEHDRWVVVTRR